MSAEIVRGGKTATVEFDAWKPNGNLYQIVYNGFDEMFLCGLSMGADGGVGSTYNFMADKFVKIRALFAESKIAEAQELQKEVNRIIAILCKVGVMQAEKEVLNQIGMNFGNCRKPFSVPTDEEKALIAKEIVPYIFK